VHLQAIHCLGISTAVTVVVSDAHFQLYCIILPVIDPVIWILLADRWHHEEVELTRAHDSSCTSAHSVLERPQVQLMHGDIPNVFGNLARFA